jgi:hypothetical protein
LDGRKECRETIPVIFMTILQPNNTERLAWGASNDNLWPRAQVHPWFQKDLATFPMQVAPVSLARVWQHLESYASESCCFEAKGQSPASGKKVVDQ